MTTPLDKMTITSGVLPKDEMARLQLIFDELKRRAPSIIVRGSTIGIWLPNGFNVAIERHLLSKSWQVVITYQHGAHQIMDEIHVSEQEMQNLNIHALVDVTQLPTSLEQAAIVVPSHTWTCRHCGRTRKMAGSGMNVIGECASNCNGIVHGEKLAQQEYERQFQGRFVDAPKVVCDHAYGRNVCPKCDPVDGKR